MSSLFTDRLGTDTDDYTEYKAHRDVGALCKEAIAKKDPISEAQRLTNLKTLFSAQSKRDVYAKKLGLVGV